MSLTATVKRIQCLRDGATYGGWKTSGTFWAGYGYNSQNWVSVIEFETTAKTENITIKLTNDNTRGAYCECNYKFLSAENSKYENADYTMASDGTITMNKYDYTPSTFTIALPSKLKAGTNYLYLWTAMSTDYNCFFEFCHNGNGYVTITYEEAAGGVPIKVNGTWVDATPQVKVNGVWTDVTPQVKANNVWNG